MTHKTTLIVALLASCPPLAHAKGPGWTYALCRLELNRGAFMYGDELTVKATIDIERFCTEAYEENTVVGDAAGCLEHYRWLAGTQDGEISLGLGVVNEDWLDRSGPWDYARGYPTLSVGLSACSEGSARMCGSIILDDRFSDGPWRSVGPGWDEYFRGGASDWVPTVAFQLGAVPDVSPSEAGPVIDDRCGPGDTTFRPSDEVRTTAFGGQTPASFGETDDDDVELGDGGCSATSPSVCAMMLLSLLIGRPRRSRRSWKRRRLTNQRPKSMRSAPVRPRLFGGLRNTK